MLKRPLVYILDLRPGPAKHNEHKASKILKKISNFMTDWQREKKKCITSCGRMTKRTKTPKYVKVSDKTLST